ncbi:MAG: c-type cytochrome biogenesis protein CcsB [Bacteroidota bacterium]
MIKKISGVLFSMQLMGILIMIFAVAIGVATFIENDFGTSTARLMVYDALWFELLLALLAVNMTGSFVKYRVLKKSKWPVITFHFSFIVILLGAAITRYVGYEGSMHIRENDTVNFIRTYENYLHISTSSDTLSEEVRFADGVENQFEEDISINGKDVNIELLTFVPNATESLVQNSEGSPVLTFSIIRNNNKQLTYVEEGQTRRFFGQKFGLNIQEQDSKNFITKNDSVYLSSPDTVHVINMEAQTQIYPPGENVPFVEGKLYRVAPNLQISYEAFYPSATINYQSADTPEQQYADILRFRIQSATEEKEMVVRGSTGSEGKPTSVSINGKPLSISYGAKVIKLPFALKLENFILDRYPGSDSPSSYESEVVLIDEEQDLREERKIYMNNVLKHRGYRFYQSSYDDDEKGTILSVNRDSLGTIVTYIGYLFLTIGMTASLFSKSSRFHKLSKKIRSLQTGQIWLPVMVLLMAGSLSLEGQTSDDELKVVERKHARHFGELLVQDRQGRIKPINTLSNEIVRKVSRKTKFQGLTPDQVFLGIILQPEKWKNVEIIKVSHPEIAKMAGIQGDHATFHDFVNPQEGTYMLRKTVEQAYAKKPAERNKFDKEAIKVDERINIFFLTTQGRYLRVFPVPGDSHHPWYTPFEEQRGVPEDDSVFTANIFQLYSGAVDQAIKTDDYSEAEQYLSGMQKYQNEYGAEILPPEQKIAMELWYNDARIFFRLGSIYGVLGFVLLILLFVRILTSHFLKWPVRIFIWLIIAAFALHVAGLGMRWYISGHAPWSDGYEALIYIAFSMVLAGILFSRKSPLTLAATAVLSSITLMVAHLAWMDPEITNLVPVLKSYWLTIHVSIITASYGFFALGALLGFLNLIFNLFKTDSNVMKVDERIEELTYINEMTLTIGLYMLTIGTFLGGVWANESWGRYWGWDPKETWALVSILVYAFIVHIRMMPGLQSRYVFNLFSVIGFSSIIMTYFGVNYYLSGLHSYAKGDPMPIPTFVYYTIATVLIVGIFSYLNDRKYRSVTGL